jgi:hypothetical protein
MIEDREQEYMRLWLTIVDEPARYQNEQTVWINLRFEKHDLNQALNHALDNFSAEIYLRMAYQELVRRGIECDFHPGQAPEISFPPERPLRQISRMRRFILQFFEFRS